MSDPVIVPMTELEAVNDMLSVIGETPVASLDEAQTVPDAQIALQLLRRYTRSLQQTGWNWNTEENFRLAPDDTGSIILPQNTLDVKSSDGLVNYASRDGKLYDRSKQTFNIGAAVNVDIVFGYAFDELPSAARNYIATVAGKVFQARLEGDPNINVEEDKAVMAARADLLQSECDDAGYNVMTQAPTVALRQRWRRPQS